MGILGKSKMSLPNNKMRGNSVKPKISIQNSEASTKSNSKNTSNPLKKIT